MANSSNVISGQSATALQYNNLRKDAIDNSSGHRHSGDSDDGRTLFTSQAYVLSEGVEYTAPYDMILHISGICSTAGAIRSIEVWVKSTAGTTVADIVCAGYGERSGANNVSFGCSVAIPKGYYFIVQSKLYVGTWSMRYVMQYIGG